MARTSETDWRKWTAEAAKMLLGRVSESDWNTWRKQRRISAEKLSQLQEDAKAEISKAVRIDLAVEFQRARDSIEETKSRMDRIFEIATEGVPVVCEDPEAYKAEVEKAAQVLKGLTQAVAASNVRLQSDKALISLLGLVAPSGGLDSESSELTEAVQLHLVPLQLTDADSPPSEHVRLAASKILELLAARPPVLGVVG